MQKEDIIQKIESLGINSTNCFPKKSFLSNEVPSIGCFSRELDEDFYFYNSYDSKIYRIKKVDDPSKEFKLEDFNGNKKYIVPNTYWDMIWEDVPFKELQDKSFKDMTLREYACIHLGIPESGLPWLDLLIKDKNKQNGTS